VRIATMDNFPDYRKGESIVWGYGGIRLLFRGSGMSSRAHKREAGGLTKEKPQTEEDLRKWQIWQGGPDAINSH